MKEQISVLLPTYNCGEFISAAIRSVLSQTYQNFELIIIDDGSEDCTELKVMQFSDPRIKYLKTSHYGYSSAINFGLKNCSNDLIAFQDSDDIWMPDKLMKQVKLIQKTNNFVICSAAYFTEKKIRYLINIPHTKDELIKLWALHGHIAISGLLISRDLFSISNGFDVQYIYASDYAFLLRIMKFIRVGFIQDVEVLVRIRSESLSRSNVIERNNTIYKIQDTYYDDINANFGITSLKDKNSLLGWREWFYGTKKKSREYWIKSPILIFRPKILIALILTFLPESLLIQLKGFNPKYRFKYMFYDRSLKNKLNHYLSDF